MNPRFRKVAVFVGAAALATGVGVGVASQGDETSRSQAAVPQQPGRPGGMDLSALADELGVSEAKLEAAMESVRSSVDPGSAPQQPGEHPLAAALAKELGLSTDKVSAALESLRPHGGPGGAAPDGAAPPDGSTAPDTGDSSTGTSAA